MNKKINILVIIITSILLLQSSIYAFSLNVEPTKMFFYGGNETKSIIVKNNGKENMAISIYLRDWEYKGKGKVFLETGKSKYSLYKWVSVSSTSLNLKPGEEKEVNVTVKPDSNIKGGYVGVVFFESQIGTKDKGKVMISGRIGTLIFLEPVGKVTRKGNITQVKTTQAKDKKVETTLAFFNEGDSHIFLKGNIVIVDYQGNILDKIKFQDWGTLPKIPSEITKRFTKELLPGNYVLVATVDMDIGKPLVIEKNITVK